MISYIKVFIPDNNNQERIYIVNNLLKGFLGLDIKIDYSDSQDYIIELANGKRLVLKDSFFSITQEALGYLDDKYIPNTVPYATNQFIVEDDIPIIYGNEHIAVKENEIICGIDIFASCFYMLTRWEEYVNKERDVHDRFPAYGSLAYKNNFLLRPVVNEYVEMLWNMLLALGHEGQRKDAGYALNVTHDIDNPYRYLFEPLTRIAKESIRFLLKKRPVESLMVPYHYYRTKRGSDRHDLFYTFDQIMRLSEQAGLRSTFYVIPSSRCRFDPNYNITHPRMLKLLRLILSRGHNLGIHGSYTSYNDGKQFSYEHEKLSHVLDSLQVNNQVFLGRQHYLRHDISVTPQLHNAAGLSDDSTLGYADHVGFRCGTGCSFRMFDFLQRVSLTLYQTPLIIMECSLFSYMGLDLEGSVELINKIKNTCKKYQTQLTVLWHNDQFVRERELACYLELLQ